MPKLNPLSFEGHNFNIADHEKFNRGLELIKESIACKGATLFSSDNMILWNKNYSFLRESRYRECIADQSIEVIPKAILWRTYVLEYFLNRTINLPGVIFELGVLSGDTAEYLCRRVIPVSFERTYFLIDLFEWKDGDSHTRRTELLCDDLYEQTKTRFASYNFVEVIKGDVRNELPKTNTQKVAFAHVDLNNPDAEVFSLEYLLPKMVEGGCIIFDDYGWWGYSDQKKSLDAALENFSLSILELPTGQGLLMT